MTTKTPTFGPTVLEEETQLLRRDDRTCESAVTHLDLYGLCTLQERQERMMMFFRSTGLRSLKGMKVLDVGCGSGGMLRRLADFGVAPRDCTGIDLRGEILRQAREFNPNINFIEGNAAHLPFEDETFDLALQCTMLTSVLDNGIRKAVASEVLRTLRPGGYVVWYDFAYSNPKNPKVRGIGRREIEALLTDCQLKFYRVTVAPPIGRVAAKFSPALYRTLLTLPFLRTHYLCFAKKAAITDRS
jgi:ubiquinone/menaquinone biosynthesis C-methylase UbiE